MLWSSPLDGRATDTIAAAIRCAHGAEICGYLMADKLGRQEFFSLENRLASPDGCFVSEADARRGQRYAAAHDLRVVAFVHSHGTGTRLSTVDELSLAKGHLPWIVVCLAEGHIRSAFYSAPGDATTVVMVED